MQALDRAVDLQSNFYAAHEARGYLELQLGRNEDALTDFTAALKGTKNARSLLGRGKVELVLGDAAASKADVAAAKALDPNVEDSPTDPYTRTYPIITSFFGVPMR